MAKAFVRINLSEAGMFFRPLALEPGCPLFDPTNANDRIMFRWFGGLVPEPEWDENEEILSFYVRNDQGGRIEDVTCTPVTIEDLDTNLATEVERLQMRFERIRPSSTTEKILYEKLTEEFQDLVENKKRPDRTYYFFKYQDGAGLWRLVWIPGYQPIHHEYGKPMICDDEMCHQLYVRLPGAKARCPICMKVPTAYRLAKERARKRRNRILQLLLLLLLLLWIAWNQFTLRVEPGPWNTNVGAATDFRVRTPGLDGFGWILSRDVTNEVLRTVEHPDIAYFPDITSRALAVSPGETRMLFTQGWRRKSIVVKVAAPTNPTRLWLEPETVLLAPGSTARVRLMGEFEEGRVAELSQSAYWNCAKDDTAYFYNGFVEGLAAGETTISARYRATPQDPWMDASSTVSVTDQALTSLSVRAATQPLPLGKKVALQVQGTTAEGAKYDFAGSSRLTWAFEPEALVKYGGEFVEALQPGSTTLRVALTDGSAEGAELQTAETTLNIQAPSAMALLRVFPTEAALAVDQILPLSIACGNTEDLNISSSDPKVVRVSGEQLVGVAAGTAEVTVSCGLFSETVPVTVTSVKPGALVLYPANAAVPVDHETEHTFYARSGDKYYPITPEAVELAAVPSSRYAATDMRRAKIRGLNPTTADDPQKVVFAYKGQTVSADAPVIAAPMRLRITPAGEVKLPLGLCMTFDGFAVYGDGVSTLVPYTRMKWNTDPEAATVEGFDFRDGKAMALAEGAGPVAIWGDYFGTASNRASLTTTARADVTLGIDVDRTLRIAGEPGQALLTGKTALGDVELVPGLGKISSANAEVLAVANEQAGTYKAVNPGVTTLGATHPAAENPASVDMRVVHSRNARLYWEPAEVNVAVGEVAPFQLMLEGKNPDAPEGEEKQWNVPMESPGVYYTFEKPDTVAWRSPLLAGLLPTEAFTASASFLPYLKAPATAKVSVSEAGTLQTLRVTPAEAKLAPGQSLSFAVEEQLEGAEDFAEILPEEVTWEVPKNVYWQGPNGAIRPQLTIPADTTEGLTLRAKYRGKTAECRVTVAAPTLNPADADVELFVKREPAGRLLPVGQSQAYSIWMKKGDVEEPAPNARWTPDFESESVTWNAPVLEALKPGHTQWLQAKVGDRSVRFYTQTINPFAPGEEPPAQEGQPSEVRILSNSGQEVSMPVGAKYVDYRVEAEYPDGYVKIVTKDATLHPVDGDRSIVSPSNGELVAVKPGDVTFLAEYQGVDSVDPKLTIHVTEKADFDELRLEPEKDIRMLPNETVTFQLHGYKEKKSVGLLTGMGEIVWKSSNPEVAEPQGPVTRSKALGTADITAEFQGVTSTPAKVEVVATIDEKLGPTDNVIKMMVGESKLVGKDFALIRGNVDFSMQCNVTPLVPGICEYDASRHALVGKTPGATDVVFTMADKKATMRVVVGGVDQETLKMLQEDGEILIEPANATISAGQALELRVYAVSKDRSVRLERTASAVFTSADGETVEVRGLQLCGLKPGGPVAITARIPEITGKGRAGTASITVDANPITELVVEPAAISMSVGDRSNLFIQGRSASGLLPLFSQPRLKVSAEPEGIVQINGIRNVEAIAAGSATVKVVWDEKLERTVPVTVDDNPYTNLAIDPLETTIAVGEGRAYQVTAMRGGRLYVLRPETGLQLSTGDPNIAVVKENMVFGKAVGKTSVVARFAGMTSEGTVNVVEPGTIPSSVESSYIDPAADVTYRPADTILDGGYSGVTSEDIFGERPYFAGDRVVDGHFVDRDGAVLDGYVVGDDGRILRDGVVVDGYHVDDSGAVVSDGLDYAVAPYTDPGEYSAGDTAGIRFNPPSMRLAKSSGPVPIQVFEELTSGGLSRDVSKHPDLQMETSSSLFTLAKGADGAYTLTPTGKDGTGRVTAKLGEHTSLPMYVQIGEVPTDAATLSVLPGTLDLQAGGSTQFDAVRVVPDAGGMPFEVPYRVSAIENPGVVQIEADGKTIRALTPGVARLQVSSVDPSGAYDSLSAFVPVTVTKPLQLTLTPTEATLRVGETTPPFVVVGRDETGQTFQVPATLSATEATILSPLPEDGSRFRAISLGKTQVRATYNGQELYATVSVAGDRYLGVDGQLNESASDFNVTLSIRANAEEGALEYRVYEEGTQPPEAWVPGVVDASGQNVTLSSPPIKYRGRNDQYRLVVESRTAGGGNVQKYPYSFRIGGMLQKIE